MRGVLILFAAGLLQACASLPTGPTQATATTAVIVDTGRGGGPNGAAFFFLEELNGKSVGGNAMRASKAASFGRGPELTVTYFDRGVPAGAVKLKLVGRYDHAAPIQNIFSSKSNWEVEGVLEADLQPGTRYRVNGVLDAFRREVWLEEESTSRIVGKKFVAPANVASSAALPSAPNEPRRAVAAPGPGEAYTCCNLHYDGDWISDANYSTLPFVPAGSRISVVEYGRHRASVLIEGRPMRVGLDYGRGQETKEQFVAKLSIKDDPRARIATFPEPVQAAIAAGKVIKGMTKEQVVISLGYPRTDKTRSLEADEWTYWTHNSEEFVIVWGPDLLVKEVDATRGVKRLVVHGEL